MKMSDGGKGSSPRKQQDQESYAKNWDAIFGKKKHQEQDPDLCPKCGNSEWDTIAWSSMSGVSPFETYCSCQCGHEWSIKE